MQFKTKIHNEPRLLAMMEKKNIDLIIVRGVENSKYFSGFFHNGGNLGYRPFTAFIFRDPSKAACMIVPAVDLHLAMERSWIKDVRAYVMSELKTDVDTYFYPDFFTAVKTMLLERNVKGLTVGTEGDTLPAGFKRQMDTLLEGLGCKVVDASADFELVRMVKTPAEIDCLRRATHITVKAHESLRAAIKIGGTDADLFRAAGARMLNEGAHGIKTINIACGPGTSFAAHNLFPTGHVMQHGDFVRCDMGALVFGYPADFVRCYFIGEASERHQDIWLRLNEVQMELVHWIKPGVTAGEIFERGYNNISKHLDGFPREFIGHGIGHATHEQPKMSRSSKVVIEPNTTVCLEFSYYHDGVRHHTEDTMLIQESGNEWWTKDCPRELIVRV
ncbi:MAG: M24 family metallopeptidase [Burkholderiales bacterium]